jgi:hypothetical protein
VATTLLSLGSLALQRGNAAAAETLYRKALQVSAPPQARASLLHAAAARKARAGARPAFVTGR